MGDCTSHFLMISIIQEWGIPFSTNQKKVGLSAQIISEGCH
jgi:hypothetical protein